MATHQELLAQANRRVKSNANRQFARKSSDAQMLDRLTKAARAVLDSVTKLPGEHRCGVAGVGSEALDELRTACRLAELRAK
jgi:hypothetical protein